jgi:hypothetical protein
MDGHGYSDHGATAVKRRNAFTAQTHCAVVTILASERRQFVSYTGNCPLLSLLYQQGSVCYSGVVTVG